MSRRLTKAGLATAAAALAEHEEVFARIVNEQGPPPLWSRPSGFTTLVQIILEQQVSLASGRQVFERLRERIEPVVPEALLALSDEELRACGFSRQKTRYTRETARAVLDGTLPLGRFGRMDDGTVFDALTAITGIGRWTANIYLLMVLCRPDAWPHGDRALAVAAQEAFGLAAVPSYEALETMAERWRPWRAVAARILWWDYLNRRGRTA